MEFKCTNDSYTRKFKQHFSYMYLKCMYNIINKFVSNQNKHIIYILVNHKLPHTYPIFFIKKKIELQGYWSDFNVLNCDCLTKCFPFVRLYNKIGDALYIEIDNQTFLKLLAAFDVLKFSSAETLRVFFFLYMSSADPEG